MPSSYSKGNHGVNLYSQSSVWSLTGALPPSVVFAADLSIVGVVPKSLAGALAPSVAFSGALNRIINVAGGIAPSVTLKAASFGSDNLVGDIAPQIALRASLIVDRAFGGRLLPEIVLAAELISGPLWEPVEPCDEVVWQETELCIG